MKFYIKKDDTAALFDELDGLNGGLTFNDNFTSSEWEGEILAGAEQRILHSLPSIPTRFIAFSSGTNLIVKGDTPATGRYFYVKNIASSSTFSGKILVLP